MAGRSSQIVSEILGAGSNARATQLTAQVLVSGATARASQVTVEALGAGGSQARASQFVIETLFAGGLAHCSNVVIEVLIPNLEIEVPPIYPDSSLLPGLTFNVKWTPQFAALETQVTDTLAEIDLALADSPIHDFELTYEFLRDGVMGNSGTNEWKTMFGFFLRLNGRPGRFFFKNPDDYTVTGQAIGTTDGSTNVFDIVRTFGVGSNVGTELVGGVDVDSTVNVYLDAVLQDPATYDIVTSIPGLQQLQFHSTPTTGQAVTMDFNFYYYCKFPETTTFEKFLDRCWAAATVKIRSCRAGA